MGANTMGRGRIPTAEEAERIRAYVSRVGLYSACRKLRASDDTIRAAIGQSRLQPQTIERLLVSIEAAS